MVAVFAKAAVQAVSTQLGSAAHDAAAAALEASTARLSASSHCKHNTRYHVEWQQTPLRIGTSRLSRLRPSPGVQLSPPTDSLTATSPLLTWLRNIILLLLLLASPQDLAAARRQGEALAELAVRRWVGFGRSRI